MRRASSTEPHRPRARSNSRDVWRNLKNRRPMPLARWPRPSAWPRRSGMLPRSAPPTFSTQTRASRPSNRNWWSWRWRGMSPTRTSKAKSRRGLRSRPNWTLYAKWRCTPRPTPIRAGSRFETRPSGFACSRSATGSSTPSRASRPVQPARKPPTTLEEVRAGLQTLTATTTGRGLLDALLEPLAQHFSMVAWCVVRRDDYVVWGSRGFDPPLQSRKTVSPVPADSPLSRALAERKPATARPTDGQAPLGLSGRPVGYAIALPIVEQGQGCGDAVRGKPAGVDLRRPGCRRRRSPKSSRIMCGAACARSRPPCPRSPRRIRRSGRRDRVKIKKSVNVTIDGAPSALVDLSTTGAQVLSPRAVRPDHSVQLMLPNDNGGLSCRGPRRVGRHGARSRPQARAVSGRHSVSRRGCAGVRSVLQQARHRRDRDQALIAVAVRPRTLLDNIPKRHGSGIHYFSRA